MSFGGSQKDGRIGGDDLKLQEMRYDGDCGLACVAMMLEIPYEDLEREYFPDKPCHGMSDDVALKIMAEKGLRCVSLPYYIPTADRQMVVVASLNLPGHHHFVVLDEGQRVLDPSRKQKHTKTTLEVGWSRALVPVYSEDVLPHLIHEVNERLRFLQQLGELELIKPSGRVEILSLLPPSIEKLMKPYQPAHQKALDIESELDA